MANTQIIVKCDETKYNKLFNYFQEPILYIFKT